MRPIRPAVQIRPGIARSRPGNRHAGCQTPTRPEARKPGKEKPASKLGQPSPDRAAGDSQASKERKPDKPRQKPASKAREASQQTYLASSQNGTFTSLHTGKPCNRANASSSLPILPLSRERRLESAMLGSKRPPYAAFTPLKQARRPETQARCSLAMLPSKPGNAAFRTYAAIA
jgi:hypothetical protein